MQIRNAKPKDFPDIKRLMVDFANHNPVEDLHNPQYDELYTDRVLQHIYKEGLIIVCEHHNRVIGMLLASIQGDIWLPHVKRMTEIAWWVEEQYRGTTAGARLLKHYISVGIECQERGIISSFTLTTLTTTPELQLEKRGWEPIDINWRYKGK